jgi:hypothetical protein
VGRGGMEKSFQSFKIFLVMGKPKWPVTKIKMKMSFGMPKLINMNHNRYLSSCKRLNKK